MKLFSIAAYSWTSLKKREIRSWLTILGIVIGIAAVVSLLTIGGAFNKEIDAQLSKLGSNTIFIAPYTGSSGFGSSFQPSAGKLYDKDVERLKKIPEIEEIARLQTGSATVQFRGKELTIPLQGVEPGVFEITTSFEVEAGRFLLESDRRVAVIGAKIANDTFGAENKVNVNSYLIINGQKFRVIGVLKESGGAITPAGSLDSMVMIPFEDARELFSDRLAKGEIRAMALRISENADMPSVVDRIKLEMDASHRVKEDERDYTVASPQTLRERVGTVLGLVTAFLAVVASISLIVGALSIASSMFTSVAERTHEIGVLRAVGADDETVMKIFLFEAAAVGGIGGLAGALLGMGVVLFAGQFGVPSTLDYPIAAFGVAFATLIGILSGYYPAKQASSISPVEALRYE